MKVMEALKTNLIKEITDAALAPAEEDTLEADYQRSSNGARLLELCQGALQLVS